MLQTAGGVDVTVQDLTITNGNARGPFPANFGGGVRNEANLMLRGVSVTGNAAGSGGGSPTAAVR